MSDHFEQVKTDILKRTAENGGPTPLDLLNAIEATNTDNDEDHKVIIATLAKHICDDKERAVLLATNLTEWRKQQAEECAQRPGECLQQQQALLAEELQARPLGVVNGEMTDLLTSWKRLKWFIIVVVAALVVMLADQLGNFIFGGMT